jgi:hypothetical protein
MSFLIQLTEDEFYLPAEYRHPTVLLESLPDEDLIRYEQDILRILSLRRDKEDAYLAAVHLRGRIKINLMKQGKIDKI